MGTEVMNWIIEATVGDFTAYLDDNDKVTTSIKKAALFDSEELAVNHIDDRGYWIGNTPVVLANMSNTKLGAKYPNHSFRAVNISIIQEEIPNDTIVSIVDNNNWNFVSPGFYVSKCGRHSYVSSV